MAESNQPWSLEHTRTSPHHYLSGLPAPEFCPGLAVAQVGCHPPEHRTTAPMDLVTGRRGPGGGGVAKRVECVRFTAALR